MLRKVLVALSLFALISALAFGQTRKEFEVASIRQSTEQQQNQVSVGFRLDGSQVHIAYLSLRDTIAIAYRLSVNQVSGPDWLSSQRFDVSAKLPEDSKQSDVNEMLQSLLEDRFRMKAHREKKEFPVYALEVAPSGMKIQESVPADALSGADTQPLNLAAGGSAAGVSLDYGNGSTFTLGATTIETRRFTMRMFANLLSRFLDREVVDLTNLGGGYDLNLTLTPEDRTAMLVRSAVAAGVVLPPQAMMLLNLPTSGSLEEALRKVGLDLERRSYPLDVIVVDEMQKTPTEN